MFDAQLLLKGSTVLSPWFPRQGDNLIITLEIVARADTTTKVEVYTKNQEDTGDGSLHAGGNINRNTVGRESKEYVGGLKELVRYKFTITGTADDDWSLFRMLMPVWFDSVKA